MGSGAGVRDVLAHYGGGASVYDTTCAGDVPQGMPYVLDDPGANQPGV